MDSSGSSRSGQLPHNHPKSPQRFQALEGAFHLLEESLYFVTRVIVRVTILVITYTPN